MEAIPVKGMATKYALKTTPTKDLVRFENDELKHSTGDTPHDHLRVLSGACINTARTRELKKGALGSPSHTENYITGTSRTREGRPVLELPVKEVLNTPTKDRDTPAVPPDEVGEGKSEKD